MVWIWVVWYIQLSFRDDVGIPVFFILKTVAFQWFTGLDKETLIGDEGNLRIFENFISSVEDEEL